MPLHYLVFISTNHIYYILAFLPSAYYSNTPFIRYNKIDIYIYVVSMNQGLNLVTHELVWYGCSSRCFMNPVDTLGDTHAQPSYKN